jgi:hypothetical protein
MEQVLYAENLSEPVEVDIKGPPRRVALRFRPQTLRKDAGIGLQATAGNQDLE